MQHAFEALYNAVNAVHLFQEVYCAYAASIEWGYLRPLLWCQFPVSFEDRMSRQCRRSNCAFCFLQSSQMGSVR